MKAVHRIRRYLLLLLFLLHTAHSASLPPDGEIDKCAKDKTLICALHATCLGLADSKYYAPRNEAEIKITTCTRYLLISVLGIDKVEITFRDDTIAKGVGAEFQSSAVVLFTCKDNKATLGGLVGGTIVSEDSSAFNKLYCKFTVTADTGQKKVLKVLQENSLAKIKSGRVEWDIEGLAYAKLKFPCDWRKPLFDRNVLIDDKTEEGITLSSEDTKKVCKKEPIAYFNWYRPIGGEWMMIDDYSCFNDVITTTKLPARTEKVDLDLTSGATKCARPKCAMCSCPFCNGTSPSPNFTDTDGTSCTMLSCEKHMVVLTDPGGQFVHPTKTLSCSLESTAVAPIWTRNATDPKPENRDYTGFVSARCVDDVRCVAFRQLNTACPQDLGDESEHKNCTMANLNITSGSVCPQDQQIWFTPAGSVSRRIEKFECDATTGNWQAGPKELIETPVASSSTIYCLKLVEVPNDPTSNLKGAGMPAGKLIGIIVGVAVVLIILIAVGVYGAKLYFKKKGNRDEMKSVSVTGRGDKKGSKKKKKNSKKDKKGSSSKTSEQISAPPPPPCPDSVPGMHIEPDPVLPNSSAPPSSGGAGGTTPAAAAAAPPVVGPDTGKPDKPAELIDIKLESEKKTDKESKKDSKKEPKDADATIVNTVTGTQSGAEPVKKDKDDKKDATVTGRTDKNGVSEGRSDTGKDKKKKKDIKKELDRHGRGLTDDDDYNIDEGAKPVNNVDKNKKPYIPAVDPNKKMINVTMTEDDEGHQRPREKPPLF